MEITTFQIINFVIILLVLIILGRYAWTVFFDKNYQPEEWQEDKRQERIPEELIRIEKSYADKVRFFNWWFQVRRILMEKVPGDFAELGVYKGESARIIHLMVPDRNFHLFDTFEGFRQNDLDNETGEAAKYKTSNFADTSLQKVQSLLGKSNKLHFHKGYFPETTNGLESKTYAYVNMDTDLYNPTKAGLEYFYPRLSPGGVIVIHDHTHKWPGILKAVKEFTDTIPESLVMVADMDGSVMIVKDSSKLN